MMEPGEIQRRYGTDLDPSSPIGLVHSNPRLSQLSSDVRSLAQVLDQILPEDEDKIAEKMLVFEQLDYLYELARKMLEPVP